MPLFEIAGIPVEFSGFENEFFDRRLAAYKAGRKKTPKLKVCLTDKPMLPSGTHISEVRGFRHYYKNETTYGIYDLLKAPDNYCAAIEFDADVKSAKMNLTDISGYGGMTSDVRSFNMLGEIFKYFILRQDGIVLHSSCIKYKNSGIAFSAPPGTGKSTHTGLWKKCFPDDVIILNDDSPVIKFNQYVPGIYGTPWSGKTEINVNESAPLDAIVILEQAPENSISELSSDEAIFLILQEVARPVFPEFMSLTLSAVEKLLLKTKVYRLKCNISDEAVMTVKNKLEL